jgi:hypothetical protein
MNRTASCFVRIKNEEKREEIREWLRESGYITDSFQIRDDHQYVVTSASGSMRAWTCCELPDLHIRHDCGTDIELFRTLAAMNDRNDRDQWFVFTRDVYDLADEFKSGDVPVVRKGEFYLCTEEKMTVASARKAAPIEIVGYYHSKRDRAMSAAQRKRMYADMRIEDMTTVKFVGLRRYCIDLVMDAVRSEHNRNMLEFFKITAAELELLPFTNAVAITFMGIIGYWHYLMQQKSNPAHFVRDAIHDLRECINNFDRDGFSPRTEEFVDFYKPLPPGTNDTRTPFNIVSCYLLYMRGQWSKEECRKVFHWNWVDFWNKWLSCCDPSVSGAAERFYDKLDKKEEKRLLVERALQCYDENLYRIA